MRTIEVLVLLGIVASLAGCSEASPPAGGDATASYKVDEVPLGPIPSASDIVEIELSEDNCHMAFVVAKDGKKCVVIEGQEGPHYDEIFDRTLLFSPDGKRLAYVAINGDKWFVVLDGQAGPEYSRICEWRPVFSPDGKRLAYVAINGDKWFVVLDGQAGPEYGYIPANTLVFSLDGKRLAYVANRKRGDKQFVVLDGQAGPEYDTVGCLVFSPDGKRMAYAARKGDKHFLVLDGQVGPEYEEMVWRNPVFRPDGTLEYLAVKGGNLFRVKHVPVEDNSKFKDPSSK